MSRIPPEATSSSSSKRQEAFYEMDNKYRGRALIFNNMKFEEELDLEERRGSEKDAEDLEAVLRKLGFSVEVLPDYTKKQIKLGLVTPPPTFL